MSRATARLRGGAMLVGIAAALAAVPSSPAAAQAAACPNADLPFVTTSSDPSRRQKVEDAIVCLTNQERAAAGLPALAKSQALHNAAVSHSRDMAQHDYFAHNSRNGGSPRGRMSAAGYGNSSTSGENIAYGTRVTARQIVQMWMNDAPHRANILNRGFREIGVGAAGGRPDGPDGPDDGTFTEDFAARR
jgi:uncharacterized protein YkwD